MPTNVLNADGYPRNMQAKLVKAKADTILGIATILIPVPAGGRLIQAGKMFFGNKTQGDFVNISVTDEDNTLGFGAGAIVGGYIDTDMQAVNQGAWIPYYSGEIMTQPLVTLGFLQGGLYVKIVGTKGNLLLSDTLYVSVAWGKP
jgi:hypothetical protein